MMVAFLLTLIPWAAILWGGGYLALRFVRAFERRSLSQEEIVSLKSKVSELEAGLEKAQEDIARLGDGQAFTTSLLAERPTLPNPRHEL